MQTTLAPEFKHTSDGQAAEAILRKCVHCGFCTATCPTYQLLGDELDGPRGRIYLIKQVLEGETPTRKTQQHLDRCLTCRNCETTCPRAWSTGNWSTSAARSSMRRSSALLASAPCAGP
jgi:glycolate oxidase iron-sulfur subunit